MPRGLPHFHDGCSHGMECFVGGMYVVQRINQGEGKDPVFIEKLYDVYVFQNGTNSRRRTEVCIRYGNEAGEYISPGELLQFASRCRDNEVYTKALELINEMGYAQYKWRNEHGTRDIGR